MPSTPPAQLPTSNQTVGTIDFGGASLELAFESANSTQTVTLYNHSHTLYAHSYLCYGRDQMELRLLANLAQEVNKSDLTVENPCLPRGFQMSKKVADIWSFPCVTAQHPSSMNLCVCVCVCACVCVCVRVPFVWHDAMPVLCVRMLS